MPKTVTVETAPFGVRAVHVDEYVFPVGEPVPDVPDDVIDQLKGVDGVAVHVAK